VVDVIASVLWTRLTSSTSDLGDGGASTDHEHLAFCVCPCCVFLLSFISTRLLLHFFLDYYLREALRVLAMHSPITLLACALLVCVLPFPDPLFAVIGERSRV
jgi:hypothetical protein